MKLKIVFVGAVFSVLALGGCNHDSGSPAPVVEDVDAADAQGGCTESFIRSCADAKTAQEDWVNHGTQDFEDYAMKACSRLEKFHHHKCNVNCQITGTLIQALCPDSDGKEFNPKDTFENCKYMESLK